MDATAVGDSFAELKRRESMMAIHVRLEKLSEDEESVVYRFGPLNECTGIARFDKSTERVEQVQPAISPTSDFDFANARKALFRLYRLGEGYPEVSTYSA